MWEGPLLLLVPPPSRMIRLLVVKAFKQHVYLWREQTARVYPKGLLLKLGTPGNLKCQYPGSGERTRSIYQLLK